MHMDRSERRSLPWYVDRPELVLPLSFGDMETGPQSRFSCTQCAMAMRRLTPVTPVAPVRTDA